ncbi:hypothetical protein, partial [Leptolyngbya sp. GGD]|uniref:hypothetical protein n=1 Tax=Leptolyngbya sp. GGD TaxID=2997907 RepID=UPI00227B59D2
MSRRELYLKFFFRNEYGESVDLELHRLRRVAINPETPTSRLRELSQHPDLSVRLAVAQNPNLPLEILKQLVFDSQVEVVHQALQHPHAT